MKARLPVVLVLSRSRLILDNNHRFDLGVVVFMGCVVLWKG